jgi:hypothetical protein
MINFRASQNAGNILIKVPSAQIITIIFYGKLIT